MLTKIGRHFVIKAGFKACLIIYAVGLLSLGASPAVAEGSNAQPPALEISLILEDTKRGVLNLDGRAKQLLPNLTSSEMSALAPLSLAERRSAADAMPSGVPLRGSKQSSGFGWRMHPVLGGSSMHMGVDLAGAFGSPVYATADGIIGEAEYSGSYGLYVKIAHGEGLETRYAHLSRLAVSGGQRVHKGEIVGYVGSTGRSTGPHLHYEVRMGGEAVNPAPFMILPLRTR